jgi:hypothetical protein
MKQIKFFMASIVVSMAFLSSCNSPEEKTKTETTADTTAAVKAPETPPPAAKPGNVMIIQEHVANFAKWKPMYESNDSIRRAYGLSSYIIGRGMSDSNKLVVIFKMDDPAKAKELTASQGMKDRMKKAGVSNPTFTFLNVVFDDSSPIEQTARLMMTHKVKDWDAWKKVFDSHKQARIDAGLIDRGLGYSVDDNHMVSIVFAITDMAKAKAFLSSPDLKAKMAEAGVEGAPTSTFYNIVQKY